MAATITSYFTFSPGKKARASEVNRNFSNYRGSLVPIEPNTQTAVDLTYNFGSSEYYFDIGHFKSVNFDGATSTSVPVFNAGTSTTSGALDFLYGSTTIGSFNSDGMRRVLLESSSHTTSSAPVGAMTLVGLTNTTASSGAGEVTMTSGRINYGGTSILEISFPNYGIACRDRTGSGSHIEFSLLLYRGETTTGLTQVYDFRYMYIRAPQFDGNEAFYQTKTPIFYDTPPTSGVELVYEVRSEVVVGDFSTLSLTTSMLLKELI